MFEEVSLFIESIFGKDPDTLSMWHMSLRALAVYLLGIILLRINKRFMNVRTVYNFFLYILMGSILAGTIVGITDFFDSLATIVIIMMLNVLMNFLVFYSPFFEKLIKGERVLLVEHGTIRWQNMKKVLITQNELLEAAHRAKLENISQIKKAYFETNGEITVI
ncbi:MAG: DUF421 domain-containing protein [Candidatus Babeliales bacterium]